MLSAVSEWVREDTVSYIVTEGLIVRVLMLSSVCFRNAAPGAEEEEEERKSDEDALASLSPPAYEDLYPAPLTDNAT